MSADYGYVEGGIGEVTQVIVASQEFIDSQPNPAWWYVLPYGVGLGWTRGVDAWFSPDGYAPPDPPPPVTHRTLLTGAEWVGTFTDAEWYWLKQERNATPATNASKQLDKFMDAIRWTDSIDVASDKVDPFYNWLLNNNIPGGQTRIDELRQGVPI